MESKSPWLFWLAVIANVSQVISLLIQVISFRPDLSIYFNLAFVFFTVFGVTSASRVIVQSRISKLLDIHTSANSRRVAQYAKLLIVFIVAGFVFYLAFQAYRLFFSNDITIVVTNFADKGNPTSNDQTTSQIVFERLQQTIGSQKGIRVIRVFVPDDSLDTQMANEIGRQNGATIVIWGWYSIRQSDVLINPHFEVLTGYPVLQPFQLNQQIVPRSAFESFEFETSLSDDYSYLSAFTIGTIRYLRQDYTGAIEIFTGILAQNLSADNVALVYNMRGLALENASRHQEAANDYLRAINIEGGNPIYYYNLGSSLYETGNSDDAITNLKRAIALDPLFASPLNSLAVIYHDAGDFSAAESLYMQAIQLNPQENVFRTNLAALYIDRAEYTRALEQLDFALRVRPNDGYLHFLKARVLYSEQSLLEAAWEFLVALFVENPALVVLFFLVVFAFPSILIADRVSGGKFSTWILLKGMLGLGTFILMLFGFKRQRMVQANRIGTKILAYGVLLQVTAYSMSGNNEQTNALIEAAASRGIYNKGLLTSLGFIYCERHAYDVAIKVFSEALKTKGNNSTIHFGLGFAYSEIGDNAKSLFNFQQSTSSSFFASTAWLRAGDLYWQRNDFRGALVSWQRAIHNDPNYVIELTLKRLSRPSMLLSPQEHFLIGLAYSQLGDTRNAETGFEFASKQIGNLRLSNYATAKLKQLRQT